jgi:hypothetical protein
MRLTMRIASLAVHVPPEQTHGSLLGTVSHAAYDHLFVAAGAHSRPPTVKRGATFLRSEEYRAPAAPVEERTSDLASRVVGQLLGGASTAAPHVRTVLHTQCTLDQQILGSSCLRVEHDHFSPTHSSLTIGQLGTAGVPTVLRLASMAVARGGLACVSACDKWMAPFYRRVPGLVTYGDAAAACLVGGPEAVREPVAVIEAVATSCRPTARDLWTAPAAEQAEAVFQNARSCLAALLAEVPDLHRCALALGGDGYGRPMQQRLAQTFGIRGELLEGPCPDVHLSTASPLVALRAAIGLASARRQPLRARISTASPPGHAPAFLARCQPRALHTTASH